MVLVVHRDDLTMNMKLEVHQLPPDTPCREQISDLLKSAQVNDATWPNMEIVKPSLFCLSRTD